MTNFNQLPTPEQIEATAQALRANGMDVILADSGAQAKEKVLELIPEGKEVMTMTSVTLDTVGLTEEINTSGTYVSAKTALYALDSNTQKREQKKIGSSPEYVVGSVHAITEDGKVVVVSNTGSQLPAYAYGSDRVIWVVGAQKIVTDMNEAMQRLTDYVLPLESERAHKAYGVPGSSINKLLIFHKEVAPGRITIILVKEVLGF